MTNGTMVQSEEALSKYKEALKDLHSTFVFHKSVIIEEILKEAKPVSIYLTGSFGRDEGSLHLSDGVLSPFRDYDILIVVNEQVNCDVIRIIRERIHSKLGIPDPYSRDFKFGGFTVWITQVTLDAINLLPLLKIYELKESSKLLWGSDVRNRISIALEEISPYNGVLILFSKVEGLLGLLDIDELRRKNHAQSIDLYYECMKTYAEMGTCLNLLVKSYEPSFVSRSIRLRRSFGLLYPELKQINGELPSLIVASAYRRLLIDDDSLCTLDIGKLLVETFKNLKIVLWYYLCKAYGVKITLSSRYSDMFDDLLERLNAKLLADFFGFFLERKIGFNSKLVRGLAVRAYIRYASWKFFVEGRKRGYRIRSRVLFMRNGNIMLRLWLSSFALLESVDANFHLDKATLDVTADRLSEIFDFGNIREHSLNVDVETTFHLLRKLHLTLLDLADKVFHQKD